MADEQQYAHSALAKPDEDPITWEGKALTPKRIVELQQRAAEALKPFHEDVRRARGLRRGTLVRKINDHWAAKNPEAALAAPSRLPHRRTLEQDLKARAGVVEPSYVRKAIGDRQTDEQHARASQDYLNEWRTSPFGSPFQTFLGKGTSDGGYARVRLPASADMEGRPDFFERLSERAHALLSKEDQASYEKDDSPRFRKRPYFKVDEAGQRAPSSRYRSLLDESEDEKKLEPMARADRAKKRRDAARDSHGEAVQRYLLTRPASTAQVIGGLDAFPIFKRGIGRDQSELACLITRQLVTVEEALEADYGWKGMGGRQLVPRGSDDTSTVGRDGCYYLYSMYFCSRDADGHERPIIVYTLGGYGTTYGDVGAEPDSKDAVGLIDLYKEYGLEGPLWSWHWGLKTDDDEPAYRGRPYLSDLADLILAIEGEETAIRAAVQVNSFTGYVEELGDALSSPNGEAILEAVIEQGPQGKALRKPTIPALGDIMSTVGKIEPFHKATIGDDAWRSVASDWATLREAIAVDQAASAPGSSGRAIVVGETLAKVAKRDIREAALEATRRDGEDHFKILAAIEKKYGICWPLQKVEKKPVGDISSSEPSYAITAFDPAWIGDEGQFARLAAAYPEEENLAAVDLESALADRGYSHFGNVMKKKGIEDADSEWLEVLKWDLRRSPEYKQAIALGFAQRRGDKTMVAILKALQEQQKLTTAGVPGAPNGMPTAALRRMGEGMNDQRGHPTAASASRGGQKAADLQTASLNQEAMATLQVGQGAA